TVTGVFILSTLKTDSLEVAKNLADGVTRIFSGSEENPGFGSGWVEAEGTVQSGGASVMVWDVCSWRDMEPLIRLETTLTGDRYLSILSDHLDSFMSIPTDWGNSSRTMRHPTRRELLPSGFRNTLLTLDTSIGHLNPQR
ncbi:hypothetical protein AVEN_46787-1, partial [Araneus ventricosus]